MATGDKLGAVMQTDIGSSGSGGVAHQAVEPSLGAEFDATATYAVNDFVMKAGVLYRCTNAHTGAWDAADFAAADAGTYLAMVAAADALASGGVAPGGFGLGEAYADILAHPLPSGTDLNTVLKNGWYYLAAITNYTNAPNTTYNNNYINGNYVLMRVDVGRRCTQTLYFGSNNNNLTIVKRISGTVTSTPITWSAWEFVNPPMLVDVEYQTTERFLGKPVFVKVVECAGAAGSTATPANASTAHNVANIDSVVSVTGCIDSQTIPYHFMTGGGTTEEWFGVVANKTNIILSSNADKSGTTYKIIFKYTKTS